LHIRVQKAFAQHALADHAGRTKKQDLHRLTIPFLSRSYFKTLRKVIMKQAIWKNA
jgi:hypothetical protein